MTNDTLDFKRLGFLVEIARAALLDKHNEFLESGGVQTGELKGWVHQERRDAIEKADDMTVLLAAVRSFCEDDPIMWVQDHEGIHLLPLQLLEEHPNFPA